LIEDLRHAPSLGGGTGVGDPVPRPSPRVRLHQGLITCSIYAFCLVVFLAPFAWTRGPAMVFPRFYLSDAPLLVTLLMWVVAHCACPDRELSVAPAPLMATLALLVATSFASSIFALDRLAAIETSLRTLVAFFLFVYIVDVRPNPTFAAAALTLSVTLNAAIGIAQYLQQRSLGLAWLGEIPWFPSGASGWVRGYGLTPHPNILGGFTGLALIVVTGVVLLNERQGAPWKYLLLVVPAAGLATSFSRSAGLGLLVADAVAGMAVRRHRTWRRRLLAAVCVTCVSTAVLVVTDPARFATRTVAPVLGLMSITGAPSREMADLDQRWIQHAVALRLIRAHPLTGVGAGNFMAAWRSTVQTPAAVPILPVHDVPVLIAAEQGLFGLASWLSLLAWVFHRSRRRWHGGRSMAMLTWTAIIVFMVVVSFFDFYFWEWEQGRLMLFIALGLWAASL
jgi:O-antigen ligase